MLGKQFNNLATPPILRFSFYDFYVFHFGTSQEGITGKEVDMEWEEVKCQINILT